MNIKGRVVTWTILDTFQTSASELMSLGVPEKHLPTNAPKTTLKKAVDIVKKNIEQDIKLPQSEKARKVQTTVQEGRHGFALVVPYLDSDNVYRTRTALSVSVHKVDATLEFRQIDATNNEYDDLCDQIRKNYSFERELINAEQFRNSVIKRMVTQTCSGTSMRPTGGVYFIGSYFDGAYERLKDVFSAFPETTTLSSMVVYDDDETLDSIELHTNRRFTSEFVAFENDIQKKINSGELNTVTFRKMKERFEEKILPKAQQHKDNLRTKFEELQSQADNMVKVMQDKLAAARSDVVEVFDFGAALKALDQTETETPVVEQPAEQPVERPETDVEKALRISAQLTHETA